VFEGFDEFTVPMSGTTIHGRQGGSGPPLLLLHGFPETHADDIRGRPIGVGHFLPEEDPGAVIGEFVAFFTGGASTT
jgi:hypothetical protein